MYGMAGVQTEVRRLVWSSKLFGPRDGLCIQDFWTACVALINRGANSNPLCAWSNKRWKKSSVYLPKSSILELCQLY